MILQQEEKIEQNSKVNIHQKKTICERNEARSENNIRNFCFYMEYLRRELAREMFTIYGG